MHKYISLRNLRFILHEVHQISELLEKEYYQDHDRETVDMMLDTALQIADAYLYPYFTEMDRNPPELVDGRVKVHPQVGEILKVFGEAGWYSLSAPARFGGMQMPVMVANAARLIFQAANNGAFGYTGSTAASANLLMSFGNQEVIDRFLEPVFSGKWPGTMALTEPDAGSSLSDITTEAIPTEDGHYLIKGQKVFISGGDQDVAESATHLTLARIQGAPKGTRGISLFAVPQFREENGAMAWNDVATAGVFHKMGQHATPAVHLIFGEHDDCRGWLVGEPNKGLTHMFQMMNEERLDVGGIAAAISSAAYYASLNYAMERPQGRRAGQKNLDQPQTLIINHPDVRRMLLLQKAITEGSIALLLECARLADVIRSSEGKEAKQAHLLLELLTPIAKTWPAENGVRAVSNGLQVLGGYGYCEDFPLEQLYRDIRITPIYEGTTGIQSQDLLGRKVLMKDGEAFMLLTEEIHKTIRKASKHLSLVKYADRLQQELQEIQLVTMHLSRIGMSGAVEQFLSDATLYMEYMGILVIGWQWLKQAIVAKEKTLTLSGDHPDHSFYENKLRTMRFFFAYELRKSYHLRERLLEQGESLTIADEEIILE